MDYKYIAITIIINLTVILVFLGGLMMLAKWIFFT